MQQTVQKREQIYMHKIYLLTRNAILIVMKSKTNSVEETRFQSVNMPDEADRQRLLFILKAALFYSRQNVPLFSQR